MIANQCLMVHGSAYEKIGEFKELKMSTKPCLNQFNGGEISPWLGARYDLPKYQYSAALLKNFIAITEGAVKRRGGSHFVASVKEIDALLLKIEPTPADANVVINGEEQRQLYCAQGDFITYSISAGGYQILTGSHIVEKDETLKPVLISNTKRCSLTIDATPEDSMIIINNTSGNTCSLLANSSVQWAVSAPGYETQTGTLILSQDTELSVNLIMKLSIVPYPKDCIVKINGESTSFAVLEKGASVTWEVSRLGYETKSGELILTETTVLPVNLEAIDYNEVKFDSAVAGQYRLEVQEDSIFAIEGTGAGSGGYWKSDWAGGSGAVYKGIVALSKGVYDITIGSYGKTGKPPSIGGDVCIKKDGVEILTLEGGIWGGTDTAKYSAHFYREIATIIAQNGTSLKKGNWRSNANALYNLTYGYGGGRNGNGGKGYLRLTYKGVYYDD